MCGETFYDRHVAQHQLQLQQITIKNSDHLRTKPIFIRKAEDGPYLFMAKAKHTIVARMQHNVICSFNKVVYFVIKLQINKGAIRNVPVIDIAILL